METTDNPFQGKVRIRACGLLLENRKILLVKHRGLGRLGYFWSPPGGGPEFGERVQETVKREFMEEVNLEVQTRNFAGFHEHIDDRFHALELFFFVERLSGELMLGTEPEGNAGSPVLEELGWFTIEDLKQLPQDSIHSICIPALEGRLQGK
jgi:8-oxo-dGTP diphosphatase